MAFYLFMLPCQILAQHQVKQNKKQIERKVDIFPEYYDFNV